MRCSSVCWLLLLLLLLLLYPLIPTSCLHACLSAPSQQPSTTATNLHSAGASSSEAALVFAVPWTAPTVQRQEPPSQQYDRMLTMAKDTTPPLPVGSPVWLSIYLRASCLSAQTHRIIVIITTAGCSPLTSGFIFSIIFALLRRFRFSRCVGSSVTMERC